MTEGALSPVMKHRLELAERKHFAAAERSVQVGELVRMVLNGVDENRPVPTSSLSSYMAFGRQVARSKDSFSGCAATTEIECL